MTQAFSHIKCSHTGCGWMYMAAQTFLDASMLAVRRQKARSI